MTDNANVVKKWAMSMKSDAENAVMYFDSDKRKSIGYISEIIGCCEAIIVAMDATVNSPDALSCSDCKHSNANGTEYPCSVCGLDNIKYERKR